MLEFLLDKVVVWVFMFRFRCGWGSLVCVVGEEGFLM